MSSCQDSMDDEDSIPPPEYEAIDDEVYESEEFWDESYKQRAIEESNKLKTSNNIPPQSIAEQQATTATTRSEEDSEEISYDEADDTASEDDEINSELTHITGDSVGEFPKADPPSNSTKTSIPPAADSRSKTNPVENHPKPSSDVINDVDNKLNLNTDKHPAGLMAISSTKQEGSRSSTPSSGKGTREFLALQKSFTESKVLSEFVSEPDRSRKSRKAPLKSDDTIGDNEKFRICRARSKSCTKTVRSSTNQLNSSAPQRWPSDEKLNQKRENMRSQNTEFVQKQMKFLSRVNHDQIQPHDDIMSEISDGEQSLNESSKTTGSLDIKDDCWQPPPKKGSDSYCWKCRKCADLIACSKCPRSFHPKCIRFSPNSTFCDKTWICPECVTLENCLSGCKKTKKENLPIDLLNQLLLFALKRMKEVKGHERLLDVPDSIKYPAYGSYVVNPVTLNSIQAKIERKEFRCTEEFVLETKWIQHNVQTAFSAYTNKDILIAKTLLKVCRQEATEIETCSECYLNANTRKDWFLDVCIKPHILLWAKLKGFPYWPAKGMSLGPNSLLNVRFFGDHDRAFVPVKDCYLYSSVDPNQYTGKRSFRSGIAECIKEIDVHIAKIRAVVGDFKYAPPKTPYDPNNEMKQLEDMMPGVMEYIKRQQANQKPPLTLKIVKTAGNNLSIIMKTDSGTDSDQSNQGVDRNRPFFRKSDDQVQPKEETKPNDVSTTTTTSIIAKPLIIAPKTYANKSNYEVIAKPSDEFNSSKINSVILKRKSDVVYPMANFKKQKSIEESPTTSVANEGVSSTSSSPQKSEEPRDELNSKGVKRKRSSRSGEIFSPAVPVAKDTKKQVVVKDAPGKSLQELQAQQVEKPQEPQDKMLKRHEETLKEETKTDQQRTQQLDKQKMHEKQLQLQKKHQEIIQLQKQHVEKQLKDLEERQQQQKQLQLQKEQQKLQKQKELEEKQKKQQEKTQSTETKGKQKQQQQSVLRQQQPPPPQQSIPQKPNKERCDSPSESMSKLVQNRQGVTIKKIARNQSGIITYVVNEDKTVKAYIDDKPQQAASKKPPPLNQQKQQPMIQQKPLPSSHSTNSSSSPPKPIQTVANSTTTSTPKIQTSLERHVPPKGLIPFEDIKLENLEEDLITSTCKPSPAKPVETAPVVSISSSTSPVQTSASSSVPVATAIAKTSQNGTDPLLITLDPDAVKNEVLSDDENSSSPLNAAALEPTSNQNVVTVVVNQQQSAITNNDGTVNNNNTNTNNQSTIETPRIVGETMIKRIVVRSLESLTMQPPQIRISPVAISASVTHTSPPTSTITINTSISSSSTMTAQSRKQQTAKARKSFPNKGPNQASVMLPPEVKRSLTTRNSMVYIPGGDSQKSPIPIKTAVSKTYAQPLAPKVTIAPTEISSSNTTPCQAMISINSGTTTTTTSSTVTLPTPVAIPLPAPPVTIYSNVASATTANAVNSTASTATITSSVASRPAIYITTQNTTSPSQQNSLETTQNENDIDKQQREAEGHILSGIVTPNLAAAITDTIVCGPPKLIHKPNGALRSDGNYGFNSDAGPVCRTLVASAHKITDFFISVMQDTVSDMANDEVLPAKIVELQMELETKTAEYEKRLYELKQNTDTMLCEMKKSMEAERVRIIAETRKQCEIERIHAVEQTKKKQWCTNCGREANSYCCWNTAYCDANCQSIDWNRHKPNCCQINLHLNNDVQGPGVLYTSPTIISTNSTVTTASIQTLTSTPGFMPIQPIHLYQQTTSATISTTADHSAATAAEATPNAKKNGSGSYNASIAGPSATIDMAYKSKEVLKLPPNTFLRAIQPNNSNLNSNSNSHSPIHRFHIPLPINTSATTGGPPFTLVNNEGNWQLFGTPFASNILVSSSSCSSSPSQTYQNPVQ